MKLSEGAWGCPPGRCFAVSTLPQSRIGLIRYEAQIFHREGGRYRDLFFHRLKGSQQQQRRALAASRPEDRRVSPVAARSPLRM